MGFTEIYQFSCMKLYFLVVKYIFAVHLLFVVLNFTFLNPFCQKLLNRRYLIILDKFQVSEDEDYLTHFMGFTEIF